MRVHAVVAAAGRGERFGGDKLRAPLAGRRVVDYALRPLALAGPAVVGVALVVPPGTAGQWRPALPPGLSCREVAGGATRAASVARGLDALDAAAGDWALVHDAARPLTWSADLARLLREADPEDGGLLALPLEDTVKRAAGDRAAGTVDRAGLWRAQTPQLFPFAPLRRALARALAAGEEPTDEAAAMEACGRRPRLVAGSPDNFKLTRPADLARAERVLREEDPDRAYWARL